MYKNRGAQAPLIFSYYLLRKYMYLFLSISLLSKDIAFYFCSLFIKKNKVKHMLDTNDLKVYIDKRIAELSTHIDNVIAEEREETLSRLKCKAKIGEDSVWVTGDTLQALVNNCVEACMKRLNKQNETQFGPYAERFFSLYKSNLQSLSIQNRTNIFNAHIKPRFYNSLLEKITTDEIQKWFNELAETKSHETLLKIKNVMSPVFDSAVEDKIISFNPFKSSRLVINGADTVGHKAIPKDLFDYIKNHLDELSDREQKLAVLLCYTGMRFEECLGLKYEDIEDGIISVSRAVVHPSRNLPEIKPPKTKYSVRKIPCHAEVSRVIGNGKGFILHNSSGNPLSYTEARRSFAKIRKTFNLDGFTAHDFRDTCATEWREKGLSLDVIARLLGHAKTETTEKRYVKYRDEILDQAKQIIA